MAQLFTTKLRVTFARTLAVALLLATAMSSALAATTLMTPITTAKSARAPFDLKSEVTPVLLNRAALARLEKNAEIELSLPNATQHVIVFDRFEDHGSGIRSSIGYLKEFGNNFRVIITTGPTGAFGSIRTPQAKWQIVPGAGHDFLVNATEEEKLLPPMDLRDDMRLPPVDATAADKPEIVNAIAARVSAGAVPITILAAPTPNAMVDLMIVYTDGLAANLGATLQTRFANLVASANTAYIDSEVAITLRLVNTTMVSYSDAVASGTALDAISPVNGGGTGVFANIESIRTANGADLVAFLRNGSNLGGDGIAWLGRFNAAVTAVQNPNLMYSVTTGCVRGCESVFIHELGHNMGNAHDRAIAAWQAGGVATPQGGAFPYSFGYFYCAPGGLTCNPNLAPGSGGCAATTQPTCATSSSDNFGTIMSYFNPTILKFSNPAVNCQPIGGAARPCGVSEADTTNSANNALSMNTGRFAIQNIKTVVAALPGTLQFSVATSTVSESSSAINVTVSRVGGSAGSASVNYATANGTATVSLDYTATSGTLTWADGDSVAKNIAVPIINDTLIEGDETFSITLSSATGAALGTPATINITINDNDFATAPGAPTIGTATPGNARAFIGFTAPASEGSSPITAYTATCNPGAVTGTTTFSPVTVSGLSNGIAYTCSVTASNAVGAGAASATAAITPSTTPTLALIGVVSRKSHGGLGPFDIPVDTTPIITGAVSVEPRSIGTGHTIAFRFNTAITAAGSVAVVDGANAPVSASTASAASDVTVTIPGIADNKRATLTLTGVNGTPSLPPVSMGFLVGDVNNTRSVTASDISGVKARSGQMSNASNFRFDVNASGAITASDISAVKARSGLVLP